MIPRCWYIKGEARPEMALRVLEAERRAEETERRLQAEISRLQGQVKTLIENRVVGRSEDAPGQWESGLRPASRAAGRARVGSKGARGVRGPSSFLRRAERLALVRETAAGIRRRAVCAPALYRCTACEKVYWKGTHYERMRGLLERVLE
jgi:hypothetical protein